VHTRRRAVAWTTPATAFGMPTPELSSIEVRVRVPEGLGEGESFSFHSKDGLRIVTEVPRGGRSGDMVRVLLPDIMDPDARIPVSHTTTTTTTVVTETTTPLGPGEEEAVVTVTTSTASCTKVDEMAGGPDFLERLASAERRDSDRLDTVGPSPDAQGTHLAQVPTPWTSKVAMGLPLSASMAVGVPLAHSVVPVRFSSPSRRQRMLHCTSPLIAEGSSDRPLPHRRRISKDRIERAQRALGSLTLGRRNLPSSPLARNSLGGHVVLRPANTAADAPVLVDMAHHRGFYHNPPGHSHAGGAHGSSHGGLPEAVNSAELSDLPSGRSSGRSTGDGMPRPQRLDAPSASRAAAPRRRRRWRRAS